MHTTLHFHKIPRNETERNRTNKRREKRTDPSPIRPFQTAIACLAIYLRPQSLHCLSFSLTTRRCLCSCQRAKHCRYERHSQTKKVSAPLARDSAALEKRKHQGKGTTGQRRGLSAGPISDRPCLGCSSPLFLALVLAFFRRFYPSCYSARSQQTDRPTLHYHFPLPLSVLSTYIIISLFAAKDDTEAQKNHTQHTHFLLACR